MKKTLLVIGFTLITLVVLAVLALPYWFGRETEKTYNVLLAQLSGSSGFHFTGKNYERGWFSATAETIISHPQFPLELIVRHRISHGPLPLDRLLEGDWQLIPAQARITSQISLNTPVNKNLLSLPPLSTEIVFLLNGDGTLHAEIPPVKTTSAQGVVVDWHGVSGDLRFDRAWRKIRFDAQMPSLAVTDASQQRDVTLSALSLHSDTEEGIAGYSFGDASLRLGLFELGTAAGRVALQGLELSSTARPVGDNVSLVIRYALDELRVADEKAGPGEVVLEARQLDANALVKFKNELDALYHSNLPPAQAGQIMAGKALALIATLSKKAPEADAHLSFKTKEGEITGHGKFMLDGRKRDFDKDPMQMLMAFNGNFELAIPAPVLKHLLTPQIRRDIAAFHQKGALTADDLAHLGPEAVAEIVDRVFPQYLVRNEFTRLLLEDNGIYRLKLTLRQGQLLINGKPWHLPSPAAFKA